jgi:hypothetical protein
VKNLKRILIGFFGGLVVYGLLVMSSLGLEKITSRQSVVSEVLLGAVVIPPFPLYFLVGFTIIPATCDDFVLFDNDYIVKHISDMPLSPNGKIDWNYKQYCATEEFRQNLFTLLGLLSYGLIGGLTTYFVGRFYWNKTNV